MQSTDCIVCSRLHENNATVKNVYQSYKAPVLIGTERKKGNSGRVLEKSSTRENVTKLPGLFLLKVLPKSQAGTMAHEPVLYSIWGVCC